MKELLKRIIEIILPNRLQLHLRYYYLKVFNKLDAEMIYISKLLKNNRRFLDIGANIGIYSFHFKKIFKNIDAFEPLTEITYRLKSLKTKNLNVHNIALSNEKGELDFYIPNINNKIMPSLASLEKNAVAAYQDIDYIKRKVEVKTLDSFLFKDVDLIKIDVEGHEESVILGAYETIKYCMPILIVEIEQRHINKSIHDVFATIQNLEYNGFFLRQGSLIGLENFDYMIHQKPFLKNEESNCYDVVHDDNSSYINSFIFLPKS